MDTNLMRRPAGRPTGGQFSEHERSTSGMAITRDRAIAYGVLEAAEYGQDPADYLRTQAPELTKAQVDHVAHAARLFGIYTDSTDTGEDRAAGLSDDHPEALVAMSEFEVMNEADRPGEDAYSGVDTVAYSEALAEAWQSETHSRLAKALNSTPAGQQAAA